MRAGMPWNEDHVNTAMRGVAEARIDAALVTLARLIGRRIAREEYEENKTTSSPGE